MLFNSQYVIKTQLHSDASLPAPAEYEQLEVHIREPSANDYLMIMFSRDEQSGPHKSDVDRRAIRSNSRQEKYISQDPGPAVHDDTGTLTSRGYLSFLLAALPQILTLGVEPTMVRMLLFPSGIKTSQVGRARWEQPE